MIDSNGSLLPAPAIHKLEGKPLKTWRSYYWNGPFGKTLHFVLFLPFFCAYMLSISGPKSVPLAYLSGVAWVLLAAIGCRLGIAHLRHICQASTTVDALHVQSPFFKRRVPWLDIKEAFLINDDRYVLRLRDKEEIFLSKDLTNSNELFKQIEKNAADAIRRGEVNSRLNQDLVEGANLAFFAVGLSLVFGTLKRIIYSSTLFSPSTLQDVALSVAIIAGWTCLWRLFRTFHVDGFRTVPDGFVLLVGGRDRQIKWDEVQRIFKLGKNFVIKSKYGWSFVPLLLLHHRDKITTLVIEQKERLKLQSRSQLLERR